MAPVSITLVANWRGEGSSEVAKMEFVDENGDEDGGGSSIGPSSSSSSSSFTSATSAIFFKAGNRNLSGRIREKPEGEGNCEIESGGR